MSSRKESNGEFAVIRDEFMHLMKDVSRDAEVSVAYRDAVEELEHAYSELDRLYNKLQKEKAARGKLENELNELKVAKTQSVDLAGQELERKNKEVAAAKEERNKMKEWLDRGVSECKRISDEVLQLRKDLETSEDNCASLVREKAQLTAHLKKLHEDLTAVRAREAAIIEEKTELTTHYEEKKAHVENLARRQKEAEEREAALRSEVGELTGRVNSLSDCEKAFADLISELGKATGKIRGLGEGIASGRVADAAWGGNGPAAIALASQSGKGFGRKLIVDYSDSATVRENNNNNNSPSKLNPADGSGPTVADTRALLHELQTSVEYLNDAIYRFIQGKQQAFDEVRRMQDNELAALQRDKMTLLAKYELEKDDLRNRCRELEEQIVSTALTTDAYTEQALAKIQAKRAAEDAANNESSSSNSLPADAVFSLDNISAAAGVSPSVTPALTYEEVVLPPPRHVTDKERDVMFTQLQMAFREYTQITEAIRQLRDENARIRHKASRRKIDWVKVNDSRTRYQHLVKEVAMMKEYQKRLLAENEHLEKIERMHIEKAMETPEEAAARRYRHKKEKQLNRVAFEEWKARQMAVAANSNSIAADQL